MFRCHTIVALFISLFFLIALLVLTSKMSVSSFCMFYFSRKCDFSSFYDFLLTFLSDISLFLIFSALPEPDTFRTSSSSSKSVAGLKKQTSFNQSSTRMYWYNIQLSVHAKTGHFVLSHWSLHALCQPVNTRLVNWGCFVHIGFLRKWWHQILQKWNLRLCHKTLRDKYWTKNIFFCTFLNHTSTEYGRQKNMHYQHFLQLLLYYLRASENYF